MGILRRASTQEASTYTLSAAIHPGRDEMKTLVVLLAACFVFADGFGLTARKRNCGSEATVDLNAIEISNCAGARCILVRGQKAEITIPFTPSTDVTQLTTKVHGVIAGVPVPFPLPEGENNACTYTGCPIQPNNPATFKYSLYVDPSFPALSVDVKWELVDQSGVSQVCIVFPATLK